jgi:hypothetical protein
MKSKSKTTSKVVDLHRGSEGLVHRVAKVVGWCQETRAFLIDVPGHETAPLRSLSTIQVSEAEAQRFAESGQEVLVCYDRARPNLPIVVGVLQDAVARPSAKSEGLQTDEKALVLQHHERVEIQCGKAKLILTKDGRARLRATDVSMHSSGNYRLRAGSVDIN